MKTYAVITAGGSGTRFGGDTPKQFLQIANLPMIVHTLRAFEKALMIDHVILVLPSQYRSRLDQKAQSKFELSKIVDIVPGGTTRQASVHRGLEAIREEPYRVAIHDAARCCIMSNLIDRTVSACDDPWDGAIAAMPISDTLKNVDGERIRDTVPRERIWGMQTPQVFRFPILRDAYRKAMEEGFPATDDATVVEQIGGKIRVVEGDPHNLKVTYPADLETAELLLAARNRR